MSTSTTSNSEPLMLDQLELGVTGTIMVMICRMWDVNSATGRYLSTKFIVSDEKGNLMHCTTRGNIAHNFLRLKEGAIYSVKNFTVQPNKDDFRVLRFAHFIVEMDVDTIVRRSAVKPDGFARYPFQLVEFDSLEPTNNKYLIGKALNRTTTMRSGSKTLDFHLANNRLCPFSVRVTLWSGLGEMLIEKRTRHVGLYLVVLTDLSVKLCNNRLYLSSTSSTMIVDDEQIPVLKQFKSDDSIEIAKELLLADSTGAKAGTFENLLMWTRLTRSERRGGRITHHVVVRNVRRAISTASMAVFGVTHATVLWTTLYLGLCLDGYRMTLRSTVCCMFGREPQRAVVKCSAGSIDEEEMGLPSALANIVGTFHTLELKSNLYYEHANYESFTCWRVVLEEALDESGSSGTLAGIGEPKAGVLVPLTTTPSVSTPSKPGEPKKARRQKGVMWAAHLEWGNDEGWCWMARNDFQKFGQYGSTIKATGRVPATTKFNVIRVLAK
ncbi:reverse transcriptase domain-containing protein [Tanacetum coccineum]|uniref:Reverse transcriptase domain-containing protein n=1 Tax=Tanacetum coccineum TaxID=301880 RepID=A0ABQ5GNR9_9ASTR